MPSPATSEAPVAPAGQGDGPASYDRVPAYLAWLLSPFIWLDRQLNRLYGSAYNPLYRSGTWATAFLLLALASGIYLLIFYRVSAPYESVQDMVARPWLVGWVRSLHRYASDAAVVAVGVHILRMLAEGKTWGSRALAWLSGIVLVGIVLIVGFTGYVMVWDTQAQALALAGAKFMKQIPIFDREMGATFDNIAPPPTSFIFMNLIVHLLLPLFLFGVLWLHTMRVARAKWLPSRRVAIALGLGLALLALVVVAPLSARPSALIAQPTAKLDLFYGGWLLLAAWPSWVVWALVLGVSAFMIAVPWVVRPRAARRPPPSQHDEKHCEGCEQCVSDCPFDAIEMAPRTLGTGSKLVAHVDQGLCVSCGICAGSCSQLAIGPPDRSGHMQLIQIKSMWKSSPAAKCAVLHCRSGGFAAQLPSLEQKYGAIVPYGVECVGNIHPASVGQLLKHFPAVMVMACRPEGCQMREGAEVARARIFDQQNPSELSREAPIGWITASPGEHGRVERAYRAFARQRLGIQGGADGADAAPARPARVARVLAGGVVAAAGLALLAAGSHVPYGAPSAQAALKLNWRIQSPRLETCVEVSAEELAKKPIHMRQAKSCQRQSLAYELALAWRRVDGGDAPHAAATHDERLRVSPTGSEHNGALIVDLARRMAPGRYQVEVAFLPVKADAPAEAPRWREGYEVEIGANQAAFITIDRKTSAMTLAQPAVK